MPFLIPFHDREIRHEPFRPLRNAGAGFPGDIGARIALPAEDRTKGETRDHLFDRRKRGKTSRTLAGDRAHDVLRMRVPDNASTIA